jgi:hypothetical protein
LAQIIKPYLKEMKQEYREQEANLIHKALHHAGLLTYFVRVSMTMIDIVLAKNMTCGEAER